MRAFGLFLIAVAVCGCSGDGGQASRARRTPEVQVLELVPQKVVLTTELVGRTSAFRKAEVRPQVNGVLLKRLFDEGGEVREGEPLYLIDPAPYKAALESAQAALARAEANVEPARLRAQRYKSLLSEKAVSRQEYDDAQSTYQQARAEVGVCRAAVKTAKIQLDYTNVLAPISGRIGKSAVTEGALVTANQAEPLASIQQFDPMYVDVTQSSLELLRLRELLGEGRLERTGDMRAEVQLRLENEKMYPHTGTLQFTDITVDDSTGAVGLRAIFPNPDKLLLPGMYVRAILNEGVDERALLVPQLAVSRDPRGQASVFVLGEGNVAQLRLVTVGNMVGRFWQIVEGLEPGEKVIVEGFQNVRNGMSVKVRAAEKTAGDAAPARKD
ncbi:MAG TPA: efflux RND transporter periplasmic adaptor subunit [Candidatus Avidesulfovibrio excrementigallinarum]|nr:efflux RND transporter periplasmic adaptor subunit [Candidatus Avidesulfovibrio excrementigallinarum]